MSFITDFCFRHICWTFHHGIGVVVMMWFVWQSSNLVLLLSLVSLLAFQQWWLIYLLCVHLKRFILLVLALGSHFKIFSSVLCPSCSILMLAFIIRFTQLFCNLCPFNELPFCVLVVFCMVVTVYSEIVNFRSNLKCFSSLSSLK